MSIAFILGAGEPPTAFPPNVWHAHEMSFGYGGAVVAGFLLTAIPNWTGRLPLQGGPLGALVVLWFCGRIAVLFSSIIGLGASAVVNLAFPAAFLAVVAREIVAGRNWRNLPMVGCHAALKWGLRHFTCIWPFRMEAFALAAAQCLRGHTWRA